jgi:aminoglycoside phosphotransferase (APT) family kinase protein
MNPTSDVELPEALDLWLRKEFGSYKHAVDVSWRRSDSLVWRVEVDGKRAYVKISPSALAFVRERDALASVVPAAGIDAPSLLAIDEEIRAIVTSEVRGIVVRALDPPPAPAVERGIHGRAGAAIAAVHRRYEAVAAPGGPGRRVEEIMALSHDREEESRSVLSDLQRETLDRSRTALTTAAPECRLAMIHGDFQPRNWLWAADTGRVALIDFETVTVGFGLEDFGWLFATTWQQRPDLRAAFLEGYGAPIEPAEEVFLAAYTVLGSLEHVAGGLRTGSSAKTGRGLRALELAGHSLSRLLTDET